MYAPKHANHVADRELSLRGGGMSHSVRRMDEREMSGQGQGGGGGGGGGRVRERLHSSGSDPGQQRWEECRGRGGGGALGCLKRE